MDYKEKYEQALERARELSKTVTGANYEYIFPELKESEEERIKKALIKILNEIVINTNYKELGIDYNIRDMIAWLEKQGEQKSAESTKDYNDIDPHFGIPAEDLMSTDKAESKFKVGNWYQCSKDFFGKGVTFDKNTAYYCAKEGCLQNEYGCHIAIDKNLHDNFKLWTIEDAKDGDVLTTDNFIFIFKSIDNSNGVHYYCRYEISKREDDRPRLGIALPQSLMGIVGSSFTHYKPATKEQRDLLFQKMKEVGYEWDSEKKELKKIEPEFEGDNILSTLGNNQVQDILEDMGLLDDNGRCPHTAEEIFKAGMEHAFNLNREAASSVKLDAKNR